MSEPRTTPSARERALRERLVAAPGHEPVVPVVALTLLLVLALVATERIRVHLDPERGLGYALGVAGVVTMVLLLIYPARKRLSVFRWLPPLRHLFRLHMTLGVIAPALILLHCDFALGSLNSTVALFCMLLVSGSGFFGRFVYSRIHRGLFGSRRELAQLRREAEQEGGSVHATLGSVPQLEARLEAFERDALDSNPTLPARVSRFVTIGWHGLSLRRRARAALGAAGLEGARASYDGFAHYVRTLVRVARFLDYERMFSFWHAVHVPLCILLFASTIVHVIAVHLY